MSSTGGKAAVPAAILAALIGLLLLAPGPAPAQSPPCADANATPQSTTTDALGESLRCLLNQRRAAGGLQILRRSRRVLHAATLHANDMVKHSLLSHIGSDGSTPLSRVRRTGFLRRASFYAVGEDLAWGENFQVTPQNVANAWLNSPVHRRNMVDGRFNRVGVAVVRGRPTGSGDSNDNALTYVAVFAVVKH
jgi:uncharacterized protein YkwD